MHRFTVLAVVLLFVSLVIVGLPISTHAEGPHIAKYPNCKQFEFAPKSSKISLAAAYSTAYQQVLVHANGQQVAAIDIKSEYIACVDWAEVTDEQGNYYLAVLRGDPPFSGYSLFGQLDVYIFSPDGQYLGTTSRGLARVHDFNWAPDEVRIYFTIMRDVPPISLQLATMDATTGEWHGMVNTFGFDNYNHPIGLGNGKVAVIFKLDVWDSPNGEPLLELWVGRYDPSLKKWSEIHKWDIDKTVGQYILENHASLNDAIETNEGYVFQYILRPPRGLYRCVEYKAQNHSFEVIDCGEVY